MFLSSFTVYILYDSFNAHPNRRRLSSSNSESIQIIAIILGILILLIFICIFIYYRSFQHRCQIEGCLVALDDYKVYSHLNEQLSAPSLFEHMQSANDGSINLHSGNHKKFRLMFTKRNNLSVGVVFSVPFSMFFYVDSILNDFEDRLNAFCHRFVSQILDSFDRFEEDYADWNDSNIHQMPLYILSIQSKQIFVDLYNQFNRNYFLLTLKNCYKKKKMVDSDQVVEQLSADRKNAQKIKKILFLGTERSGKSTIMRQLQILYGGGFDNKKRSEFVQCIHAQVIEEMLECIELCQNELSDDGVLAAEQLKSSSSHALTDYVADLIEALWNEDAIQAVHNGSTHFFDEIRRISKNDFVPNDTDLSLMYHQTNGVNEQKFEIRGNLISYIDICNQQSELRKWIHSFDQVDSVIFVASLSCYDEMMHGDESKNAMQEQINLFSEICNSEWFRNGCNAPIILFLNKKDVFAEKIKKIPITECDAFAHYNGSTDSYDACASFIRDVFESCYQQESRQLFTHFTCAVDRYHIEKVINDTQLIVINASLARGGLVGGISLIKPKKQRFMPEVATSTSLELTDLEGGPRRTKKKKSAPWGKKKKKTRKLAEVEDELKQQIADNEAGFGKDIGGSDEAFNPMATGVPEMNYQRDPSVDELNIQSMQRERHMVDDRSIPSFGAIFIF